MPRPCRTSTNSASAGSFTDTTISISRIHRLHRPLRNKVQALSALLTKHNAQSAVEVRPKIKHGATSTPSPFRRRHYHYHQVVQSKVTYGSKTRQSKSRHAQSTLTIGQPSSSNTPHPSFGPLSALPQQPTYLSRMTSSIPWEKINVYGGIPILELSRRVYAVRDAFRNVVEGAYKPSSKGKEKEPGARSLAELCTAMLGCRIESDMMEVMGIGRGEDDSSDCADSEDGEDEDVDVMQDADANALIDEYYEQLLDHVRQWAIVPHAIHIILHHVSPPLPSLYEALIDVCAEYDATPDALIVLPHLLAQALAYTPAGHPLNSKLHQNYLVDLLRKSRRSTAKMASLPIWTEHQFLHAMFDTLEEIPDELEAWTSHGMGTLFEALETPVCSLRMTLALARTGFQGEEVEDRLYSWTRIIFETWCGLPVVESDVDWVDGMWELVELLLGRIQGRSKLVWQSSGPSRLSVPLSIYARLLHLRNDASHSPLTITPQLASHVQPSTFLPLVSAFDITSMSGFLKLVFSHAIAFQTLHPKQPQLEAAFLASAMRRCTESGDTMGGMCGELESRLNAAEERCVRLDETERGKFGKMGKKWKWEDGWGWVEATPVAKPKPRAVVEQVRAKRKRRWGKPESSEDEDEDDEDEDEDDEDEDEISAEDSSPEPPLRPRPRPRLRFDIPPAPPPVRETNERRVMASKENVRDKKPDMEIAPSSDDLCELGKARKVQAIPPWKPKVQKENMFVALYTSVQSKSSALAPPEKKLKPDSDLITPIRRPALRRILSPPSPTFTSTPPTVRPVQKLAIPMETRRNSLNVPPLRLSSQEVRRPMAQNHQNRSIQSGLGDLTSQNGRRKQDEMSSDHDDLDLFAV
ncbi:hypothetical protein BOTBODRAFT_56760 [Botryobasidium botryosum FD-172 SS1]|uniref:Uncharacterized protein n=1 Tax=Botryobasidium botryosum (strain FD-172 SS1) TaxID=930990 RepID=A0A067M9N9_BOTB1|nr:hypothetical protein BOTBODRAFT_56760 [Botryobasidium botryosum FD-172 SS1]